MRLAPDVRACVEMMSGAIWVKDQLELAGWEVQVAHARKVRDIAPLACKRHGRGGSPNVLGVAEAAGDCRTRPQSRRVLALAIPTSALGARSLTGRRAQAALAEPVAPAPNSHRYRRIARGSAATALRTMRRRALRSMAALNGSRQRRTSQAPLALSRERGSLLSGRQPCPLDYPCVVARSDTWPDSFLATTHGFTQDRRYRTSREGGATAPETFAARPMAAVSASLEAPLFTLKSARCDGPAGVRQLGRLGQPIDARAVARSGSRASVRRREPARTMLRC